MIIDPIILSGASFTHREIEYAAEAGGVPSAIRTGRFIHLLRDEVTRLTRQKYALALNSPHAAMHTALMSLGIGSGDEVLVPEIAPISLPAAITHVGATPVFCDIDPNTLCLSPEAAAKRLTGKTRAIVPVHMYGQTCNMGPLLKLAKDNDLKVIEDATHGIGASYFGHPTGAFGLVSVMGFSANGPVSAANGAVLVTSREDIFNRAVQSALPLPTKENALVYESLSFDCGMSNLQAAVGFAQLQRLDELLAKKRQLFAWYRERLADTPGISLPPDFPQCVHSRLMPLVFLNDPSLVRRDLMKALYQSSIMCSPSYYPLSYMPMFTEADNPVAYGTGIRTLLLPGGHNRTEEEVDYVCAALRQLLANRKLSAARVEPKGWLKHKSDTLERVMGIKKDGLDISFTCNGAPFILRAVTSAMAKQTDLLDFITDIRRKNQHALLSYVDDNDKSMHEFMKGYETSARDFLLFLVLEGDKLWGHIALDDFEFQENSCKVDAVMLRQDAPKGLGVAISKALHAFAKDDLKLSRLYSHIIGSNRASRLSASVLGFRDVNQVSLYRLEQPGGWVYRPMYIMGRDKPDETFVLSAKDLE